MLGALHGNFADRSAVQGPQSLHSSLSQPRETGLFAALLETNTEYCESQLGILEVRNIQMSHLTRCPVLTPPAPGVLDALAIFRRRPMNMQRNGGFLLRSQVNRYRHAVLYLWPPPLLV